MKRVAGAALVAGLVMWAGVAAGQVASEAPRPTATTQAAGARFAKEIAAFEAKDREAFPGKGGVVFVGSSSIRGWKTDEWFPGMGVINRGFGGSHVSDSVEYAERIILPYEPRLVVFYAGENDIAGGKSPERVAGDLKALLGKITGALPETRVVVIGPKPSISRWRLREQFREAGRLMKGIAEATPNVSYVSLEQEMLGADGTPRPELFIKDGLHMTPQGYEIWTAKVMPVVKEAVAAREK